MSRSQRKARKYNKFAGAVAPNVPRLPSNQAWEEHNRANALAGREQAIDHLTCQQRGCPERLASLELDPDAAGPGLRLAIRALWTNEWSADRAVLHRIRLLGATDPAADAMTLAIPALRKGQRIEMICRRGHESRFGPGHLTRRLRDVLP